MSFDEIWQQLLGRKWLIGTMAVLGFGAAMAYWYLAPREYESFARVLVLTKDPTMASATQDTLNSKKDEMSDDVLATHRHILTSDAIIQKALRSPELADLTSIEPYLREEQTVPEYIRDRMWALQGSDNAKAARTIDVGFRHHDADDCRRVVAAVVAAYRSFLKEQFQDIGTQAAGLIGQASGQLEQEIETLEREHLALRQRAPIQVTRGDHHGNVHEENFAEIGRKISELQVRLGNASARLKAIRDSRAQGTKLPLDGIAELSLVGEDDAARLNIFNDAIKARAAQPAFLAQQPARAEVAKAEYERLSTLRGQERSLLEDFGPKHPDVVKKRHDIASLEEAIQKRQAEFASYDRSKDIDSKDLIAAYEHSLDSDVSLMTSRLADLKRMAAAEEAKARELVSFELNDKIMSSRVERKQQLYDAVVSRLQDVNLRSNYGSFVNEVLVPAKKGRRVWPRLWLCALAGIVGGAMLGSVLAVGSHARNTRFRTIGELKSTVGYPVLATLPRLAARPNGRKRRFRAKVIAANGGWDPTLELHYQDRSTAADAVRGLRNALLLSRNQDQATLLLVTSPESGDGKSTTAANLALAIAHSGRSVLIVDANLCNPRLHQLFGSEATPGLGELLETTLDPQEAVASLGNHLHLLPSGTLRGTPADVLQTRKFEELCALLRERFDYVIFDGASVLTSSDSRVLASAVDQVLVVTRPSTNARLDVLRAIAELKQHGGNVVGIVANSWDAPDAFAVDPTAGWSLQPTVAANRTVDLASSKRTNGSHQPASPVI